MFNATKNENFKYFHLKSKFRKVFSFLKITKRNITDFDPNKDYYKILGVDPKSTDKEIKDAYYKLAKKHHPDLNGGKKISYFRKNYRRV